MWCHVQVVDAAISESVFNMLEGCVPEFTEQGYDRPPSGSTISGTSQVAPVAIQAGAEMQLPEVPTSPNNPISVVIQTMPI